eukprot:9897200-Lingulodinium_polyedra.AAC.1
MTLTKHVPLLVEPHNVLHNRDIAEAVVAPARHPQPGGDPQLARPFQDDAGNAVRSPYLAKQW